MEASIPSGDDVFAPLGAFKPPQEERIPTLIDSFLQNVHTKNPVLNVELLVKEGRKAAQQGLGWDAWSCLVLLACALGSVAKPFDMADSFSPLMDAEASGFGGTSVTSRSVFARELEHGDSYFLVASRRLGTLKHTLLGAQCHFLAGGKSSALSEIAILTSPVYLMYTMRPLLSWQYFYHASILFQLHLKTIHGIHGTSGILEVPAAHLSAMDRKQRRLEQCLYWSCFKSECEFRVELPLPQSEIGSFQHPNLFPSPPSPAAPVMADQHVSPQSAGYDTFSPPESMHTHSSRLPSDPQQLNEERLLKQHSKQLCREEESWYYYLTEIALRRIGNRIINTFFRQEPTSWLNVRPLLRIAQEFDVQVSSWSAHLPPAMKHYEATSTIKAPMPNARLEDPGNSASRELSWATDNRILEMRSWLYQPFLYYLIHSSGVSSPTVFTDAYNPTPTRSNIDSLLNPTMELPSLPLTAHSQFAGSIPLPIPNGLDTEETAILHHMITSGIECNMKILDVRSLMHRHHGLWYDLRSLMCASLILLAVAKSGNARWIPGGVAELWGPPQAQGDDGTSSAGGGGASIRGKIGNVLQQFEFWAGEAPELTRHRDVLVEVTERVRRQMRQAG